MSVKKEQANAQQQGHQGEPKGIVPPPVPGATAHYHLIGEEIAPCHGHDEAQEEASQPSRCASGARQSSAVCVYHAVLSLITSSRALDHHDRCSSRTIAAPRTMARSFR